MNSRPLRQEYEEKYTTDSDGNQYWEIPDEYYKGYQVYRNCKGNDFFYDAKSRLCACLIQTSWSPLEGRDNGAKIKTPKYVRT